MRALLCCAITLAGCANAVDEPSVDVALLEQPLLEDDTQPAPEVSANPTEPQHGLRHLALPGGRVLRAGYVLRILDVRDPQYPHIEGELSEYNVADGLFYRFGHHAIFQGGEAYSYRGEREDVPIPRRGSWALLNADFSDYTKPRLINKLALSRSGILVQGQGQSGDALYMANYRARQEDSVYLSRYELQAEELVLTGEIELPHEVERFETAGTRVLINLRDYDNPGSVVVIDGSRPDLRVEYEASIPGIRPSNVQALVVDGPKLRVAHADTSLAIDTFDLTKDDALGKVGTCEIKARDDQYASYFEGTLYSKRDHALFAGDPGQGLTWQIPFDPAGKCLRRRILDQSGSRAFQMPDPERLFALNEHELRLFNLSKYVSYPLIARAPIEHFYYYTEAARPIQVFKLGRAATAPDGTREPWLVGLPYYDEYSGVAEGAFQLFSASRRTLTPRSTIYELARTGDLALFDSTLVTMSSEGLRTFDIGDLSAPKRLGSLELDVTFSGRLRFGDYVARIRTAPLSGPPTGIEPLQELLIVRLGAIGETPVATWRIRRSSFWLKADDLLLEVRWIFTDSALSPYLTIQAYDMSDPSRPRRAGFFFSDEIRQRFPGSENPQLHYRAIGRSLAIAQRHEVAGSEEGPWTNLRMVDFQDPDDPKLVPYYEGYFPEADLSLLSSAVQGGTSLYYDQQRADGVYGTRIGFEDMSSPYVSSASLIPDPIQAATSDAVYTATPSASLSDLTVSRVLWNGSFLPPSATRTFAGRTLASIRADGGPYVYLTHAPRSGAPQGTGPRSHWTRLEVLDATTLQTVGALDLDTRGRIVESASGRLFIAIPDALLFVDVRNPARPTARAAVPFGSEAELVVNGSSIHIGAHSYSIDLRNLKP